MKRTSQWILALCAVTFLLSLGGCSEDHPVKGFVLPQGDAESGLQVFTDYKCFHCHSVPGREFPEPEFEAPFILDLGGQVYRVQDYGELLTAVTNPDHILSPKYVNLQKQAGRDVAHTPMPDFSEQMTVAELIDLVEFLHAQYSKLEPKYYRGYYLTK
jgi:mono/diheme cytochrome c family protein